MGKREIDNAGEFFPFFPMIGSVKEALDYPALPEVQGCPAKIRHVSR
jgi:hypothetical protein